jgi:tRNA-dihydrouridine synthase
MVGISHVAFREWIRLFLPAEYPVWVFTEMLSSRRVPSQNVELTSRLKITEQERQGAAWLPQLLVNEKRFIKPSIEKLEQLSPVGLDINMGCPVKRTLKHNWGVRLMGDPDYAADVVSWCRESYQGPLSVKMRLIRTQESTFDYMQEFISRLSDAGADWVTVHARYKENRHAGKAEWGLLRDIKGATGVPVVANGGVSSVEDVHYLLHEMNMDGVMLARAALAKPWLVWQYFHSQNQNPDQAITVPAQELGFELPKSAQEQGTFYLKALLLFADSMEKYFDEDRVRMERLLFFVTMSQKWFDFGHSFWKGLKSRHSWAEYKAYLAEYTSREPLSILQKSPIQ